MIFIDINNSFIFDLCYIFLKYFFNSYLVNNILYSESVYFIV